MRGRYATRLLKLRVDEIEVCVHVPAGAGETAPNQAVRLVASSMAGQWLKTDGTPIKPTDASGSLV